MARARRASLTLKAHLLGGLAGRLAGARVVWHVRDHLASPYLPAAAVPLVRLAARAVAHRVVAVSASVARTVGRSDVVVVRQGVRTPEEATERPPGGPPRVGLVGRIAPWKGQDVFVAAAARLAPELPDAEFVLAGSALFGEEGYERELRAQVTRLGLDDRVRFLGFRDDVWEVYRELDVVVHASTQPEPYGNVVLEAMACRRALVAAAAGGVLELVDHGRTGLLVPPGDPEALADAVGRLLRSPEERRRRAAGEPPAGSQATGPRGDDLPPDPLELPRVALQREALLHASRRSPPPPGAARRARAGATRPPLPSRRARSASAS
jgi:glycosyltransferase involved in cell wall biosynthesis